VVGAAMVAVQGAPVALPDGRFHGKAGRTFAAPALAG